MEMARLGLLRNSDTKGPSGCFWAGQDEHLQCTTKGEILPMEGDFYHDMCNLVIFFTKIVFSLMLFS